VILYTLLGIPLVGIFLIASLRSYSTVESSSSVNPELSGKNLLNSLILNKKDNTDKLEKLYKKIAFITSILNLIISLIIYILFDFSNNQFQFIQEHYNLGYYEIYLGVDGISIYFVLLTTIIMPIALISN
jgi:NADH-ubiquinone oxidoreductase chain 4